MCKHYTIHFAFISRKNIKFIFSRCRPKSGQFSNEILEISSLCPSRFSKKQIHTTYTRNNMGQKCEGDCGLWVLNKIIKKIYPENLKKIVGALWELPAK